MPQLRFVLLSSLVLALACDPAPVVTPDAGPPPVDAPRVDGGPPPEPTLTVDLYCPGMAGCMDGGDTGLMAGAGMRDISPDMTMAETLTLDMNGNGEFDEAMGDTFDDVDGDGRFEGEWIAGFGTGRAASAVNMENRPWARALALRNGDVTIAFVAMDCVGLFIDEMDLVRDEVAALSPAVDVDYVFVSATHDHEARDTVGIWGASISDSGYSPEYMTFFRHQAALAVADAVGALEPATVEIASFFLRDVDTSSDPGIQSDVLRYVGDNRDPFIYDDQVRVMRLVAMDGTGGAGTTDTISTFINYAAHPEYQGSRNTVISSDFAGWMRNGVEAGAIGPDGTTLDGVGGITVFVNGPLGVQIGPNYIRPAEWDGTAVPDDGDEAAQTVGEQLAWHVLNALGTPTEEIASFPIAFRRARFPLLVQNTNYHIAFNQDLFGPRELFDFDPTRPIRRDMNLPSIMTEVAIVDLGPIQMLTMPGELDPLLFTGISGDRAFTPPDRPVVDPAQENPADLTTFPTDGYLIDHFRAEARDSDNMWILGLTNDFTGYFVAPYDYELATTPYLVEAPGDHYEETNSVGPLAWPRIERLTRELFAWTPP